MAYLTRSLLLGKAIEPVLEKRASLIEARTKPLSNVKRIFLSHSHKDKELAHGLRNYLFTFGIELYIDWLDASMPEVTGIQTANKIKDRMRKCDIVLVLATNNAMKSRWVPWEIGFADSAKTPSRVIIVPVVDNYDTFDGNEYCQLYSSIRISDRGFIATYEPNNTEGTLLDKWLKSI